jgi:hypothetical protein
MKNEMLTYTFRIECLSCKSKALQNQATKKSMDVDISFKAQNYFTHAWYGKLRLRWPIVQVASLLMAPERASLLTIAGSGTLFTHE